MLLKVITVKNVWFVISFSIMDFEDSVCNGCHDLTMCLNFSDIVLLLLKMLISVVLLIAIANLMEFIKKFCT